jgi:hypothetical protein
LEQRGNKVELDESRGKTEQKRAVGEGRVSAANASIKKIEESYSASRMVPKLERRKEESEKKRQGFRPMNERSWTNIQIILKI